MSNFIILLGDVSSYALKRVADAMPCLAAWRRYEKDIWIYAQDTAVRQSGTYITVSDSSPELQSLFWAADILNPEFANNAFAAAIIKQFSCSFSLWRDVFGARQLYYSVQDGLVCIGTFLPAILAVPGISRQVRDEVFDSIDLFGFNIFTEYTPFKAVRSVPPGCKISYDGELRFETWGTFPQKFPGGAECADRDSSNALIDEYLEEMLPASFSHWSKKIKNGALAFSGGLDSSALLLLSKMSGVNLQLHTQGLAPGDASGTCHDADAAREIALEADILLNFHPITTEKLSAAIVDYIWQTGIPLGTGPFDLYGGVAFHALCAETAPFADCIYCGEGADELFMGYYRIHVNPGPLLADLRAGLAAASPAVRERAEEIGFQKDINSWPHALRQAMLHYGMSEYHLPSVRLSASAFGMEVATPYMSRELWEVFSRLAPDMLIDTSVFPAVTKLPLRRFVTRHALGPAMEYSAVRRKRAMAYSASVSGTRMEKELARKFPENSLPILFQDLFHRLHVDPGYTQRPNTNIFEVLSS